MQMVWASLLFVLISSLQSITEAKSFIDSCNTADQCTSLVSYRVPSTQKLQDIAALFGIDTVALLGANDLDLNALDPENLIVGLNQEIKVPVSCSCIDGIWRSSNTVYRVKAGDTLHSISTYTLGGLVSSEQIALANGIHDGSLINIGTQLTIRLPCGCDYSITTSSGSTVLLTYVVKPADTALRIANDYGTTLQQFLALNNMNNATDVIPGDVVAIPLSACVASFRPSAVDAGMVVASGTYIITADHCVQCSCSSPSNLAYCTPAPSTIGASCPVMRCSNTNLTIGQTITSLSVLGCNVTSCLYDGYKKQGVLTSLESATLRTCPAPPVPLRYRSASQALASASASAPSASVIRGGSQVAAAPGPSFSVASRMEDPILLLGLLPLLLTFLL